MFEVVRVTEPSDLEALYRFRHEVYVDELGWLPPDPSGLLRDGFDDLAYNYVATDGDGKVVGSMRVVPDSPAGLPLERVAPLDGFRDGARNLVELCRLVVRSDHRGSRLGGLLMKAGYQRAVIQKASHIVIDTYLENGATMHLYEKMGFGRVSDEYHDPFHLRAEPSIALSLDITRAQREWPEAQPGLHRFFTCEEDFIEHG